MTRNKELVLSEKKMRAGYGATLISGFSDVIESRDYPDFEAFAAKVRREINAEGHVHMEADVFAHT